MRSHGTEKGTNINKVNPKKGQEGQRGATWLETRIEEWKTRKKKRREDYSKVQSALLCGQLRPVVVAATRAAAINFWQCRFSILGFFPSFRLHRNAHFPHQSPGSDPEIRPERCRPLLVGVGRSSRCDSSTKPGVPKYQDTTRVTWSHRRRWLTYKAIVCRRGSSHCF